MISLIGVGVSFDKKYVRKTGSSPGNMSPEDFHRVFVTNNIIHPDPRTIDYSDAMPKMRQETKNVLEEYNKGNKELVKKALRNIADYIKNDSGTLEFNSNQAGGIYNKGFYKTIGKFMNDPDLGVEKMFSEKDLLRVKANAKKLDAYEKSNNAAKELLLNPADANTPEREQQVLDYMLNMATASVTSKSVVNEEDSYNDLVNSISDFIDNDPRLITDEEGMSKTSTDIIVDLNQTIAQKVDDKKAASAKYKFAYDNVIGNKSSSLLRDIYQKDNVAPEEAILSEENGEEKLKEQLKTKIKESDLYQSLMKAKTPKEMSMALNKADMKFRAKGLDAIPHDKFESDLAKKVSLGKTEEYKKTIDRFRKDFRLLNSGSAVRKDLESVTAGINAQPARFNVFQKGHKDSKSIENLREKTAEFEKILYTVTKEPAMDDPKARKALFEAYKASIEYQNEKMTAAGVDPTNTKWEPTSSMGKERFRGARKIEEQVYEENLPVEFLGRKSHADTLSLINRSDVLICASREETMSAVVIEAMMYEKCAIVSNNTGVAEFIVDNENAYLFNSEDEKELAKKIKLTLCSGTEVRRIGQEARKTYEHFFDMKKYYQRLDKVFKWLN